MNWTNESITRYKALITFTTGEVIEKTIPTSIRVNKNKDRYDIKHMSFNDYFQSLIRRYAIEHNNCLYNGSLIVKVERIECLQYKYQVEINKYEGKYIEINVQDCIKSGNNIEVEWLNE